MGVRSKQEILDVLRSLGLYYLIEGHESELPDPIDTDRDSALLERFGINRGQLMEAFGSSP